LVHGEAIRQVNLLELRDELKRRGFTEPDKIEIEDVEVTDIFTNSELTLLRREDWDQWTAETRRRPGMELGEGKFCVRAARLKGLAGTLIWPTQPDLSFSAELAGRVRVIAGLDRQPILFHSEKWPDYQGSLRELRRVRSRLACGTEEPVVIVWGSEEDTLTAIEEIRLRYVDAIDGVPNETRQPFVDGSTDFERILPGPDRMYPDTDSPPTRVTRDRVERLRIELPDTPWERQERYGAAGVPRDTINYLIRRGGALLVDRVVAKCGADLRWACFLFGERLKGLRRAGMAVDQVSLERWCELFRAARDRPVLWQGWDRIIHKLVELPDVGVAEILADEGWGMEPTDWRESLPSLIGTARKDVHNGNPELLRRLVLGRILRLLRGKVEAPRVAAAVDNGLEVTDGHVK
jgi:glutamyl-tRNA(Gln) amidotransferase subunit E